MEAPNAVRQYHAVVKQMEQACAAVSREKDAVRLVGVTKTVDPTLINAVLDAGLTVIGENRVQEFLGKYEQYRLEGKEVHFIGTLQKNKVKYLIDKVDMIESVDDLALAKEIDKRSAGIGKVMPVLIQVNIDRQESKSGIDPDEAIDFMKQAALLANIRIKGLMCIPDPLKTPKSFEQMKMLFEAIKEEKIPGIEMEELSMGMSGDYTEAIRCGATLVRVGRGIFGERNYAI